MRTETKTFTVYTYNTAPENVKEKIKEKLIGKYWYFDHILQDRIDTLKAFSKKYNLYLDYCLGPYPDRGEFIKLDGELPSEKELIELNKQDCPLTGCYYDHDLLEALIKGDVSLYIDSIHKEAEWMNSDEYTTELCDVNGYEFLENGDFY